MTNELANINKQDLQIIENFVQLETEIKKLKKQQELVRADLVDIMEDYAIKKWSNDHLTVTYIAGGTSQQFDSTKFKKEHPEIVEQYQKTVIRKPSVRVVIHSAK